MAKQTYGDHHHVKSTNHADAVTYGSLITCIQPLFYDLLSKLLCSVRDTVTGPYFWESGSISTLVSSLSPTVEVKTLGRSLQISVHLLLR